MHTLKRHFDPIKRLGRRNFDITGQGISAPKSQEQQKGENAESEEDKKRRTAGAKEKHINDFFNAMSNDMKAVAGVIDEFVKYLSKIEPASASDFQDSIYLHKNVETGAGKTNEFSDLVRCSDDDEKASVLSLVRWNHAANFREDVVETRSLTFNDAVTQIEMTLLLNLILVYFQRGSITEFNYKKRVRIALETLVKKFPLLGLVIFVYRCWYARIHTDEGRVNKGRVNGLEDNIKRIEPKLLELNKKADFPFQKAFDFYSKKYLPTLSSLQEKLRKNIRSTDELWGYDATKTHSMLFRSGVVREFEDWLEEVCIEPGENINQQAAKKYRDKFEKNIIDAVEKRALKAIEAMITDVKDSMELHDYKDRDKDRAIEMGHTGDVKTKQNKFFEMDPGIYSYSWYKAVIRRYDKLKKDSSIKNSLALERELSKNAKRINELYKKITEKATSGLVLDFNSSKEEQEELTKLIQEDFDALNAADKTDDKKAFEVLDQDGWKRRTAKELAEYNRYTDSL